MVSETVKYPIGRFERTKDVSPKALTEAISILQIFPEQIKQYTYNLSDETLDKPYREGGWTIRQLIHHISDSHHHAYNRIRWALTEDNPEIKVYDQDQYAKLDDYSVAPISWSIQHLDAVHRKLVYLLENSDDASLERTFRHPEMDEPMSVKELALMYAWHSMHHFAHIKNALEA